MHLTIHSLYLCCVHYATYNIQKTLLTTWNYTCRNLDIACNELSSIKQMCLDLFSKETSCGPILVNDHLP